MIPFLLAAAGGYLIAQSRKDSSYEDGGLFEEGGMTDEIKEGDVLEADYEKEYINYYKVVSINKENPKDIIVTFQNVNPTQKEITQTLSSLNDEIKQGKYELVTKVNKNGYSTGNYIQKQNNIVREGNYLKEVVEKQPVFRVIFFDEGRNEWSLRDTYDESLDRIGNETIKDMIKDGSLQKKLNKVFYKKGGTIQQLSFLGDGAFIDDYEATLKKKGNFIIGRTSHFGSEEPRFLATKNDYGNIFKSDLQWVKSGNIGIVVFSNKRKAQEFIDKFSIDKSNIIDIPTYLIAFKKESLKELNERVAKHLKEADDFEWEADKHYEYRRDDLYDEAYENAKKQRNLANNLIKEYNQKYKENILIRQKE